MALVASSSQLALKNPDSMQAPAIPTTHLGPASGQLLPTQAFNPPQNQASPCRPKLQTVSCGPKLPACPSTWPATTALALRPTPTGPVSLSVQAPDQTAQT